MKRAALSIISVLIFVIVLSSCGQKSPTATNPPVSPISTPEETSVAETPTQTETPTVEPNPVTSLPPVTTSLPPTTTPAVTPIAPTTTPEAPVVAPKFVSGIYYRVPGIDDPGGNLAMINPAMKNEELPAFASITLPPTYFTMNSDKLVTTDNDTVLIYAPDGKLETLKVAGLYQIGRPSLSPDGNRVAVQAAEIANPQPEDLNIYVVELATGKWERISNLLNMREEAPRWFPKSNIVAYTSFTSGNTAQGMVIQLYDVDAHKELRQISNGAGGLDLTISPDEKTILNANTMTLYDLQTGAKITQFRTKVAQALQYLGFQEDTRFPGQASRGTLILHGTFSPDGKSIIIDGAAKKNGAYVVYIARVAIDVAHDAVGLNSNILILPNNPAFSNNNSYSQMSPFWLP
jgi:hypothetical protein